MPATLLPDSTSLRRFPRFVARCVAGALFGALAGAALGQVPIPMQEQIRLFNTLPPAQQQSLIRELQRELPPAQRTAVLEMLQGGGTPNTEIDPNAEEALDSALDSQTLPDSLLDGEEIPRLKPKDTLVIEFTPLEGLEEAPSEDFQERLAKGNPYQLDGSGRLYLPGVPAIALAGLNVDEATVRVKTEPELRQFEAILTFLPLQPVDTEALKPFGYDLFARAPTRFTPPTDIPVPVDYVIGPGDTVNVQLFGNQNAEYFLVVSREGTINFPEIGPVSVSGLSFADLRNLINQRVTEQMIGVRASITLGELRSIRVFVVGDAVRPGGYTVSGLATMTHALVAGGGVKPIGSLRSVALMRDGNTISTLDLYDLLLRGDMRSDARLQPGDVIFVPPIGTTVMLEGEVRRPAIYEVRNERTVAEVIALAGGLNPNANRADVKLRRVVPNRGVSVQEVDLTANGGQTALRDGDVVLVQPNLEQLENSVRLAGNVFRPGVYQWFSGMRLRDLLPAPELVKPLSDLNYVLIRRESQANVAVEVLSADLRDAWQRPAGPSNVLLEARDTVFVFNLEAGRGYIVEPIIDQIAAQSPPNTPLPVVRVGGQVRAQGEYPLESGMRISDLLRAGGGLSEAAYGTDAELTRYAVVNGEYRETELLTVNLAALLRGDATANLALTPYDYLNIKEVSRWRGEETVTIRGEVVFPGSYPIRRGEKLSSLLARAGGLTDLAFPAGSVFTREELRERETEQIEVLASRIERDLAAISVSDPNSSETINTGQSLISQLRSSVATGRLVIRLDQLVAGVDEADIVLKNGDLLIVPDERQEVTVLGEVQYGTSHVYERGLSRDDYLAKSGGFTQRADKKRIYVVRANGAVVANSGSSWFSRDTGGGIQPGDAIVVPLDVDQPLARWTAITTIIYNMALAAAAVNSF